MKGEVLSTKTLTLLRQICFHYNSFSALKKKKSCQSLHYRRVFIFTLNFRKVFENITSEFCLPLETMPAVLCEHYTVPLLAVQKALNLSHTLNKISRFFLFLFFFRFCNSGAEYMLPLTYQI